VKKYAPYLLMAGVLFFAYFPVLTGYYLHTDDYFWSKWGNFPPHDVLRFMTMTGRPLTGLLYACSVFVGQLAGMNVFRFLSVLNLCAAACLLFRWLCFYKCDRWFSSFLSAAIFTLPPFQVYVAFLSTAPDGLAVTLSILALVLVHRADTRSAPTFYNLAATLLLVMAFALYQHGACFYLTLLCVPLLMEKDPGSVVFWRKIFVCLCVFALATLLYYLPWRWWLEWAAIPSNLTGHDGRVFVTDFSQRWQWFMQVPFIEASNFWNINPVPVVSYVFMGFVATVLLCRLIIQKTWGSDLLRYFFLLALIPGSFFISLLSSAPPPAYRTYPALSVILLLAGILPLVFVEKTKYRLSLAGLTCLLMIVGACWAHRTVENYFAIPDSKEIRYIIQSIKDAQQNGQADFSGVAIVMINHPVAPGARNEIGEPSSAHGPNIRPIVMTALNELGIKKEVRVFDCYLNTVNLYWEEYGMVFNGLSLSSATVYPQDHTIIIDMNKMG